MAPNPTPRWTKRSGALATASPATFERGAATFTTVVLGLLALAGVVSGAGVATSSSSYLAALTVVLAVGTFVLVRRTSRPVVLYASVGVLLVSLGAAFAMA